jgi:hypothetical protein
MALNRSDSQRLQVYCSRPVPLEGPRPVSLSRIPITSRRTCSQSAGSTLPRSESSQDCSARRVKTKETSHHSFAELNEKLHLMRVCPDGARRLPATRFGKAPHETGADSADEAVPHPVSGDVSPRQTAAPPWPEPITGRSLLCLGSVARPQNCLHHSVVKSSWQTSTVQCRWPPRGSPFKTSMISVNGERLANFRRIPKPRASRPGSKRSCANQRKQNRANRRPPRFKWKNHAFCAWRG